VFDNGQITSSSKHTPSCCHCNGVKVPVKMPETSNDCTDQMQQRVEEQATHPDNLHDTPAIVWHDCVAHFMKEVGPTFYGLDKSQMRNLVYHSRE